jgi:hypothetical protein
LAAWGIAPGDEEGHVIRIYSLNARSRPAAIALAAAAIAVGAVFVAFGVFLLLGLAAVGTVVGAGVLLFRALTGRTPRRIHVPPIDPELDPTLEVFPTQPPTQAPRRLKDSQADKLTS